MRVKDIMSETTDVVSLETPLAEAAERMQAIDVGLIPVRLGDELVGVVTERDMALRAVAQGLDPRTATVGAVMTPEVHFCFDDESVEDAAGKMAERGLRRLVVLDRAKRLVGIVSLDDVAAGAANPTLAGEALAQSASRLDHTRWRYERILVALDGSILAERVLATIEPLARQFGSQVTLLRVVTPADPSSLAPEAEGSASAPGPAGDVGPVPASEATSQDDTAWRQATSYLTAVQQRLAAQGLTVERECPEGPASEMILRRARQLAVDLIALTTHGRTGMDRLLLGSVAEDVVRRAPCPVHLVRVQGGQTSG
jgi:nucleotide-binding universal stress UspA family protein/CBS domain-containing protein